MSFVFCNVHIVHLVQEYNVIFAETVNEWPLPFPVAMWDLEHCSKQSKHGTGKKLVKHGLTKLLRLSTRFSGLCLTPVGNEVK